MKMHRLLLHIAFLSFQSNLGSRQRSACFLRAQASISRTPQAVVKLSLSQRHTLFSIFTSLATDEHLAVSSMQDNEKDSLSAKPAFPSATGIGMEGRPCRCTPQLQADDQQLERLRSLQRARLFFAWARDVVVYWRNRGRR